MTRAKRDSVEEEPVAVATMTEPDPPGLAEDLDVPMVQPEKLPTGKVRMFHPKTGASKVVPVAAYEECWRSQGWRTEEASSDPTEEPDTADGNSDESTES